LDRNCQGILAGKNTLLKENLPILEIIMFLALNFPIIKIDRGVHTVTQHTSCFVLKVFYYL
jgi:hypothetical protein